VTEFSELAQSLKDNEAFQAALNGIRADALEALATMKRDDAQAFYTAQATVKVVDAIRSDLEQFILAGKPKAKPGIA
jgi:hypothetical protein